VEIRENWFFDIQKAYVKYKKKSLPIYIVSFAPKGSNKWVVFGVYDKYGKAEDILGTLADLDREILKRVFNRRYNLAIEHIEVETIKKDNENIKQNN